MRRLLVSVAFLAALLIVPSAALALDPPANASAPAATNQLPVITWTDVLLGLSYHVFRADAACATNPTFPLAPVGTVPPGVGSFTDTTVTLQGNYCYFVQTDDGGVLT